jgi:DNA repair protein RadC
MSDSHLPIKDWALEDRPREKLMQKGISALSDTELIAVLLGNGHKNQSALDLARVLLMEANHSLHNLAQRDVNDLMKLRGIGPAKAINIMAAIELGRRRTQQQLEEVVTITGSKDVASYFISKLGDLPHEEFWVLYLNRANRILYSQRLSQGGISGTVIDIRILMKEAVSRLASSLIVCHNHPSGSLKPSSQDISITLKIRDAAKLIDVPLLDHLVVSNAGFYSFADEGIL